MKVNEQLSLEEFLDPYILKWMDIDSLMDSEHTAIVMYHSSNLGLASVPQVEVRGILPNVLQVRNLTEESTSDAFNCQNSKELMKMSYSI